MILIVDDKPENLLSLKKVLELHGFDVDTADSGEDALKKILRNSYSLIILDVQMPGMDGFEVAETLSGYSKAKDIPVIFLSAVNTDKKFIAKGYTAGGIDYVTKPVDPDIFILKVKTLNRLYEQTRQLSEMHRSMLEEVEVRKLAETELTKKIHELRSILEALPQIAFTLTATGDTEFVNEHWYLYSNSVSRMPEIHRQDAAIYENWRANIFNGTPLVCEVRIRNIITGEYRYHLLRIIPVRHQNEISKWVGTFTDIHVQKEANEILEQKVADRTRELTLKNEELEASNHELQQFASVASHDLKEPLRKIQLFSSILENRYRDVEGAGDTVARIIDSSQRMSVLINDLLSYSRLSVSSLYQQYSLREIVDDIVLDLDIVVREKQATIEIGELPAIEMIPGQIRQVFQNLVSNALKFTKPGTTPVIRIWAETVEDKNIDSTHAEDGNYVRIFISDNGIGFNEKYLDRIFTIFQRLHSKEAFEGTGIGLAIARKIVDKHNGLITARSKEGEGSTFIIVLPLQQSLTPQIV